MAVEVGGERALVLRLAQVVQLLADPLAQLLDEGVHVLARGGDPQQAAQQPDVAQVGGDRLGDARVLHLDRDGAAVVGDGAVHLPDGGGRDGPRVPGVEDLIRRAAEFFGHDLRGELGGHRRHAVLERAQHAADRRGEAVVHVAGDLADLHQDALHRPEGVGDVFGVPQRQVVAQLLRAARRPSRTAAARSSRTARRRAPRAGRRQPAAHPQPRVPAPASARSGAHRRPRRFPRPPGFTCRPLSCVFSGEQAPELHT